MFWVFWLSLFLLGFTYAGYPLTLALLSRVWNRPHREGDNAVTLDVSVLLVARNESERIEARLENLLACEAPGDLEIIVVCGDSEDDTAARARRVEGPITVLEAPETTTKARGLNLGLEAANGEIVVFADARQRFDSDTIVNLARPFSDREVGAVSGNLEIEKTGSGAGAGIDFYWKLEKFIRRAESRIDSSVGCTGAVYAIRRELSEPIPPDTILDDVVIPMRIAVRGNRVLFVPEARAFDPQTLAPEKEQRRKVRTLAGNYQMLFRYPAWLFPWKNRLWFQLIAHKYLRLAGPVFLAGCLAGSLVLSGEHWIYRAAVWGQGIAYGLGVSGLVFRNLGWFIVSAPAGFLFLQWQCVRALFYYLGLRPKAGW